MKQRIFLVVNDLGEIDFEDLVKRYLSDTIIDIGTEPPVQYSNHDLVVLWNYRKIIKQLPEPNNMVIFHSSPLPLGRGWAPIFYAIFENQTKHYITGIKAAPSVDTGEILIQARFSIKSNFTATDLRRFDQEITFILIARLLEKMRSAPLISQPQRPGGSYRQRRSPEENQLNLDLPLRQSMPLLKAVEAPHPAFVIYEGKRFFIRLECEEQANFPEDLQIIFPDGNTSL